MLLRYVDVHKYQRWAGRSWEGNSDHFAKIFWICSLAPWRFEGNFRWVIFMLILVIDVWCISYEIILRWMSLDLMIDKSTLVQVMACCRQATSHYLNQCWTHIEPHLYRHMASLGYNDLTPCGLITWYNIIELGQYWFRQWLVAFQLQTITWSCVDSSSSRSFFFHMNSQVDHQK